MPEVQLPFGLSDLRTSSVQDVWPPERSAERCPQAGQQKLETEQGGSYSRDPFCHAGWSVVGQFQEDHGVGHLAIFLEPSVTLPQGHSSLSPSERGFLLPPRTSQGSVRTPVRPSVVSPTVPGRNWPPPEGNWPIFGPLRICFEMTVMLLNHQPLLYPWN